MSFKILSDLDLDEILANRSAAAAALLTQQPSSTLTAVQHIRIKRKRVESLRRSQQSRGGLQIPQAPVHWIVTQVPSTPVSFHDDVPEVPEPTLLKELHPHERDKHIRFVKDSHTYYVHGTPTLGSVTGLIRRFSQEFDADSIIVKMMKGSRWPRPGYLHATVPSHVTAALKSNKQTLLLAAAYLHPLRNEEDVARLAQRILVTCPELRELILQLALSPEEIKQKWDDNRISAANCGTWMHLTFEFYLNRCIMLEESVELSLFIRYLSTLGGLTAYRTEWTIYGVLLEKRLSTMFGCL